MFILNIVKANMKKMNMRSYTNTSDSANFEFCFEEAILVEFS